MPRKSATYWLVKIARLTGWLLFFLVLLYIVTGFALCGRYGVSHWISAQRAKEIHGLFEWPLIVVFVTHSVVTIYFALRRWGWIGRRART